jgi:WD40 repeat protein
VLVIQGFSIQNGGNFGLDKTVRLWEVASGVERTVLRGHEDLVHACAFSPDGQLLASASEDGALIIWNVPRRSRLVMLQLGSSTVCCCHPGSHSVFAVGTQAGEVAVFDLIQPPQ